MPPIGKKPDEPLNAYQLQLVKQASYQFLVSGGIEVSLTTRLASLHIDYREILDGCMASPNYKPTIH